MCNLMVPHAWVNLVKYVRKKKKNLTDAMVYDHLGSILGEEFTHVSQEAGAE